MFQNQLWLEYAWFRKAGMINTVVWELVVIPSSIQQ